MALRADQWLILGVAGLGVYALYRLSKTTHDVQTTGANGTTPDVQPTPPPQPGVLLPETRGRIEAPPLIPFVTGDPNAPSPSMTLSNSRAYRGRGENLTEDDVAFFDVRYVYSTPEAARAAEFPEWSLTGASRNTRWFYGRYLGQDATYARPAKIDAMWITPRPPPISARPTDGPVIGHSPRAFPEGLEAFFRNADVHAQSLIAQWRRRQGPGTLAAFDRPPERCVLRAQLPITNGDGIYGSDHRPGTLVEIYTAFTYRGPDGALLYAVSEPGIATIAPLYARVADVAAACALRSNSDEAIAKPDWTPEKARMFGVPFIDPRAHDPVYMANLRQLLNDPATFEAWLNRQ